jgi:hypothetical protein
VADQASASAKEILDQLVAEGRLQAFTNQHGVPMWGLPAAPDHEHEWISPDVRANRNELRRSPRHGASPGGWKMQRTDAE